MHTQAHDEDGQLLAEGDFKVVPLSPGRFREVAGIEELPDNWRGLVGEA